MLRFLCFAVALIWGVPALAQTNTIINYRNGSSTIQVSPANPLPVNASVSASISGFNQESVLTPFTATTGGATSGSFTAGKVIIVANAGTTNTAYCQLGASADTSGQPVPPNSSVAFTSVAETAVSCATASSTTTINVSVGTGLPTGWGGGGGGSGGGAITMASGAVSSGAYSSGSIASGAFASGALASGAVSSGAIASGALAAGAGVDGWDLTQGAKADSACGTATGTCSVVALLKYLNTTAGSAIPAGTNIIGKVGIDQTTPGTTNGVALVGVNGATALAGNGTTGTGSPRVTIASDNTPFAVKVDQTTPGTTNNVAISYGSSAVVDSPCQTVAKTFTPISITTATTTRIIAPAASKKTYICSIVLQTASANNVGVVEGTGGTCGTGTAGVLGGTTAGSGLNLAANEGWSAGNGSSGIMATAGTNVDFCLITSAATNLAGHVSWVQK